MTDILFDSGFFGLLIGFVGAGLIGVPVHLCIVSRIRALHAAELLRREHGFSYRLARKALHGSHRIPPRGKTVVRQQF